VSELPADLVDALGIAASASRLLVTSDFDGTLAPIVSDPAAARPLPDAADALIALADLPSVSVALISGRALDTLRELSSMPSSVALVGSHGAEFDSGFAHEIDGTRLQRIVDDLTAIAEGRPGVAVERKPASVALHVRNASEADGDAALKAARAAASDWDAEMTTGKRVLEFAVISTDKGEAVDILRERADATAVVFFGDDVTDEKAFARMRDGDVGVKVGSGDTLARYRVDAPEDVATALAFLRDGITAHTNERAGTVE
jgi:trehalose 6-phosphate phosphatase